MKLLHINLISKSILLTFLFMAFFTSKLICGQYEMAVGNISYYSQNEIEFDVTIRGVENSFNLTSFQIALAVENLPEHSEDLQFSYIESSTQLTNTPAYGVHASSSDGLPEVTFAALPGNDTISQQQVLIGRFRLISELTDLSDVNFKWDFEGINSTIILGNDFIDITIPENHVIETVTGLDNSAGKLFSFALSQNYPNPFNPSTVINFSLQKEEKVNLSIYNILGQLVTTLVNDNLEAGLHSVTFNAANLASGVYFYNLNAVDFSETRKMILQK